VALSGVAPLANAGLDQSVTDTDGNGRQAIALDGSGSWDDGQIVSWVWSEGVVQLATGAQARINLAQGTHTLTLTVTDDEGLQAQDEVVVTVNPSYTAGLLAEFFDFSVALATIPNLSGLTPDLSRTDSQINYASTGGTWTGLPPAMANTFASRHTGYVLIPGTGTYTFYLNSDDGSKLWIDGALLINNDGLHSMREYSAAVAMSAGYHSIRVEFFENAGSAGLILSWSGPGIAKQVVPAANLYTVVSAANHAPSASGETWATNEDTPLTVGGSGVLANDSDAEGDAMRAVLVRGPQSGKLTLRSDGSFIYVPDVTWPGDVTFSYAASDGRAIGPAVTVTLRARYLYRHAGAQAAPAAQNDTAAQAAQSQLPGPSGAGVGVEVPGPAWQPVEAIVVLQGPVNQTADVDQGEVWPEDWSFPLRPVQGEPGEQDPQTANAAGLPLIALALGRPRRRQRGR
jgi:hypothetical protein